LAATATFSHACAVWPGARRTGVLAKAAFRWAATPICRPALVEAVAHRARAADLNTVIN